MLRDVYTNQSREKKRKREKTDRKDYMESICARKKIYRKNARALENQSGMKRRN